MELKLKDFATFTDKDENGETFSHTGQIVGLDNKTITLDDGSVVMTFPRSEENLFAPAKRPRGWKGGSEPVETKPTRKTKAAKGGSKRERVEELVAANPKMTRKEHIELAIKEVGMTPAGASSYVSAARKKVL